MRHGERGTSVLRLGTIVRFQERERAEWESLGIVISLVLDMLDAFPSSFAFVVIHSGEVHVDIPTAEEIASILTRAFARIMYKMVIYKRLFRISSWSLFWCYKP